MVIVAPPDLVLPENLARLKTDREIAEETGRLADAFPWPTFGLRPKRSPIFAAAQIGSRGPVVDEAVTAREEKTPSHFGFMPAAAYVEGFRARLKDMNKTPPTCWCRTGTPCDPSQGRSATGSRRCTTSPSGSGRGRWAVS